MNQIKKNPNYSINPKKKSKTIYHIQKENQPTLILKIKIKNIINLKIKFMRTKKFWRLKKTLKRN